MTSIKQTPALYTVLTRRPDITTAPKRVLILSSVRQVF